MEAIWFNPTSEKCRGTKMSDWQAGVMRLNVNSLFNRRPITTCSSAGTVRANLALSVTQRLIAHFFWAVDCNKLFESLPFARSYMHSICQSLHRGILSRFSAVDHKESWEWKYLQDLAKGEAHRKRKTPKLGGMQAYCGSSKTDERLGFTCWTKSLNTWHFRDRVSSCNIRGLEF